MNEMWTSLEIGVRGKIDSRVAFRMLGLRDP